MSRSRHRRPTRARVARASVRWRRIRHAWIDRHERAEEVERRARLAAACAWVEPGEAAAVDLAAEVELAAYLDEAP